MLACERVREDGVGRRSPSSACDSTALTVAVEAVGRTQAEGAVGGARRAGLVFAPPRDPPLDAHDVREAQVKAAELEVLERGAQH